MLRRTGPNGHLQRAKFGIGTGITPPSIFDLCKPRDDVASGAISDSDYAANLANVLTGRASRDYIDPPTFVTNTYPDPALVPTRQVRVAAFDRQNADPANGHPMGDGVRAHTPWGEIAFQLAGKAGFEVVRCSDEQRIAPGADTIKELFGSDPVLVVLDELGEYLRRVQNMGGRDQLVVFLKALLIAIEGTVHAAIGYTLAVRSDGKSVDAWRSMRDGFAWGAKCIPTISPPARAVGFPLSEKLISPASALADPFDRRSFELRLGVSTNN